MHTIKREITESLHDAFRAALVLTGSVENAECAVTDVIATIGSDCSRGALLAETARAALSYEGLPGKSRIPLPPELQALFLLSSRCRHCFVLIVLMRLDLEACSEILGVSANEVKEALDQSLRDLHPVQTLMDRPGMN
jgi:hypothetical protein